jgi:hypothetical protein
MTHRSAPPVGLTSKTRELLRLLASDPVMQAALAWHQTVFLREPHLGMLSVSRMEDSEWQIFEDKYR